MNYINVNFVINVPFKLKRNLLKHCEIFHNEEYLKYKEDGIFKKDAERRKRIEEARIKEYNMPVYRLMIDQFLAMRI